MRLWSSWPDRRHSKFPGYPPGSVFLLVACFLALPMGFYAFFLSLLWGGFCGSYCPPIIGLMNQIHVYCAIGSALYSLVALWLLLTVIWGVKGRKHLWLPHLCLLIASFFILYVTSMVVYVQHADLTELANELLVLSMVGLPIGFLLLANQVLGSNPELLLSKLARPKGTVGDYLLQYGGMVVTFLVAVLFLPFATEWYVAACSRNYSGILNILSLSIASGLLGMGFGRDSTPQLAAGRLMALGLAVFAALYWPSSC